MIDTGVPWALRAEVCAVAALLFVCAADLGLGAVEVETREQPGRLIQKERDVRYQSAAAPEIPARVPQPLSFDDALRTLPLSRAAVRFDDQSQVRLRELSRLEIRRRPADTNAVLIRLQEGQIYVMSRGRPESIPVETPQVRGTPKGTEFLVSVDAQSNRTEVTMFDGVVELSDGRTNVTVHSGQQGIAVAGQGIVVRPVLEATNIVQWWIYYPGVLNVDEAGLSAAEQATLRTSLNAYQAGDLARALEQYPGYPAPATPISDAERTYLAALFLAVGAVDKAETLLSQTDSNAPPARALRLLIQAVRGHDGQDADSHSTLGFRPSGLTSASELLALSYAHQSTNNLPAALESARAAAARSTNFGFAWARVAELEFSFGHTRAARQAVEQALRFTPTNAQAHALRGFLLAAENRIAQAIEAFDRAIAIDPALGNAWLGRGLCKRKAGWFPPRNQPGTRNAERGTRNAGLETPPWLSDLQTAAALEPRRALSRSYAGKAFADAGDERLARKELNHARTLDPNDPTSWLYSALLNQQDNRVNEAAEDLEESIERNDNRAVYRSGLLLDQDRAVRGANLASVYRDAGLADVSYREAARAVNADYANYSAHLFLANSFSELLNYTPQVNLRYETPRVSEYLVATLLAPVGAGVLSPMVSQQEYSRLFERDRLGVTSTTEYLSRGAWTQSGAQFGTIRNLGYSLDAYYKWDPGQRTNNDQEITSLSVQAKQQFGPADSVFVQVIDNRMEYGDLAQDYDPNWANPLSRTRETQEPILLAGYHHEWSPQSHTLLLAGRLQDTVHYENPLQQTLTFDPTDASANTARIGQDYELDTEVYTVEAQHIFQQERVALIFGGRYQGGHFDVWNNNDLTNSGIPPSQVFNSLQDFQSDFERLSAYGYAHWQVADPLRLIAGVAYDRLTYPVNLRSTPLSTEEDTTDQVSPKAGLIFTPAKATVFRAGYGQSLGGVSIDQSFRLEPSQVAGFNQAWRSLMPESVVGSSPAEQFETAGASLEQKFPTRTYVAVSGDWLHAEVDRVRGAFDYRPPLGGGGGPAYFPSGLREQLDFTERTLTVTLNQLVGNEWAFGVRYRLSQAELDDLFPDVTIAYGNFRPRQELEATLHQVNLFALYNHPCGFFAQFESLWTTQENDGYEPELPGDDFWQFNLWAGYRFARRQAEVRLGVLNLTDQDYSLNPLNLTSELPRERTLFAGIRFSF